MFNKIISYVLICLLVALAATSSAQGRRSWYPLAWQGANAPFEKAKEELKKQTSASNNSERWISQYRHQSDSKPGDPMSQFKYALATLLVTPKEDNYSHKLADPLGRMLKIQPPYTREYTRLLFVIEFYYFKSRNLLSVGRRLLKELPDDVTLNWQVGVLLSQEADVKTRREAVFHTAKAIRAEPKNIGVRFTHAMCAYWIFYKAKTSEDAKFAISAFKDYLRIAPNNNENSPYRKAASNYIQHLEYFFKNPKAFEKWGG